MIGLDTNVLVRYIMQDDARQARKATRLVESLTRQQPGFISVVCVVELVWVLSSCYTLNKDQLVEVLDGLLRTDVLVVDRTETVARALRLFRSAPVDFADALIQMTGADSGCSVTWTFDVGASKAAGMQLIT